MSERATRPLCAESQSLRNYLETLLAEDVILISDPIDIDYRPTALVLDLENRPQAPVVSIARPIGSGKVWRLTALTGAYLGASATLRSARPQPGGRDRYRRSPGGQCGGRRQGGDGD